MRLLWSLAAIAAVTSSTSSVSAFSVQQNSAISRGSTALNQVAVATADVKAKQDATLEKLKSKDAGSNAISKDVSFTFKL